MAKTHLYEQNHSRGGGQLLLSAALFICLILLFLFAVRAMGRTSAEEGTAQLEKAIRRACVTCYATEGRYPKNLQAIISEYGVVVDESAYVVYYEAFAENLMPDITVIRKEAG